MSTSHDKLVEAMETLWRFHCLGHRPSPSSVLIGLGGNDLRIARHVGALLQTDMAGLAVVSGGIAHQDDLLNTGWSCTEAERFAAEIEGMGIDKSLVLQEPLARNTAENLRFSMALLRDRGIALDSVLIVCKPHMQRRAHATAAVEMPEIPYRVVSFTESMADYCSADFSREYVTQLMVGDLERLEAYGRCGYCAPQRIPASVREAYEWLSSKGFDKHRLKPLHRQEKASHAA